MLQSTSEEVQETQISLEGAQKTREEVKLERLNIDQTSIMQKFKGLLLVIALLACSFIFLTMFTSEKLSKCMPTALRGVFLKAKKALMYNSILRYVQQVFFSTVLCAMMNLKYSFKHGFETLNTSSCVGLIVALAVFALFTRTFMLNNKANLGKPEFIARYGALYVTVEYASAAKGAVSYTWYFCSRRLMFAAIVAFLSDIIVVQVLLLT